MGMVKTAFSTWCAEPSSAMVRSMSTQSQNPDPATARTTHFGFKTVDAAEKAGLVREVFDAVADRYDVMNDLMSLGVHRLWKNAMIDALNPRPGMTYLDVAGGTGDIAFRIAKRVAAKFLCLEFSKVVMPILDRAYDTYSFSVLPFLGRTVAHNADAYRYLAESIRKFPPQEELCAWMREAGFGNVGYRNYSGGIAALHSGWRI